ncbi:SAVED domain-containing protein [Anaeromyxobacter oryzisoli]|uniref:SAVED domain-containing protein n=1 Tax=Anaeromyxobacter oryzisoli TaxID=2925408 RepID=UPI001F5A914B|nr:SAVED domain-containing protein [Anaeromyxobacter sp. SG63]
MAKAPPKHPGSPSSPVTPVGRKIKESTRIVLAVAAGGRCEFRGCNQFLFEHPLTLKAGNYSENAHIVAFSQEGPRGESSARPRDINALSNLMLLCKTDHTHIDKNPSDFPVDALKSYKAEHENRIRHVTGLAPNMRTTFVQLKAKIGGDAVGIPIHNVTEAVAPRYPSDTTGYVINLTDLEHDDDAFVASAEKTIATKVRRLYEGGSDVQETRHISLFALAPIHLLVYLGTRLSNKMTVDFFQLHRDGENPWAWKKTAGPAVKYTSRVLQRGTNNLQAALVLSLSGAIDLSQLPAQVTRQHTVYEITLARRTPSTDFLRRRKDLQAFRRAYRDTLAKIRKNHPRVREIELFPAVPAPAAIVCGYDLLPKIDPLLRVYDNDRNRGGFTLRTTINPNDKQYD